MRFRSTLLCFLLLCSFNTNAIRVIFDCRVFYMPEQGAYAEFVTSFDAATFALAPADSQMFQAKVELTIIISAKGQIIDFRKVAVDGPLVQKNEVMDFLSLERFMLPAGSYDLEVEIKDLNDLTKPTEKLNQKIDIILPSKGVFISDIEFVSAYRPSSEPNQFSKSGYDILPYVSNYYPTSLDGLIFYAEIYGTDSLFGAGNPFVSNVCVLDAKNNEIENCKRIKREKAASVVPMIQSLDISDLPTGEYKVRIEVRNKLNELVYMCERTFSRNHIEALNPMNVVVPDDALDASFATRYTDRDSLYALLLYHLPIAGDNNRNTIDRQLREAELRTLQSFFYSFWLNRDAANPEAAWKQYEAMIIIVRKNFETRIKPGWQTDRGRVYLQYGKPNTRIMRPNDPDYWPFEIWHYYSTNNNLHNRRFLFYDTKLTGDLELLHSDVPSEIKNFAWKDMVRSRPAALSSADISKSNANQRTDPNSRDEIEDLWYNPH